MRPQKTSTTVVKSIITRKKSSFGYVHETSFKFIVADGHARIHHTSINTYDMRNTWEDIEKMRSMVWFYAGKQVPRKILPKYGLTSFLKNSIND